MCEVAWGDFSKSDFAKPPMGICGETVFLKDLPRRRDLAVKRTASSPQRARKHESKVVLEKYYFALPGWSRCPSNFGTAKLHGLLPHVVLTGKSQEGQIKARMLSRAALVWFATPEPCM